MIVSKILCLMYFLVWNIPISDYFNLSSANTSSQWHIIQCIHIVKIITQKISKILKAEIKLSFFKLMYLSEFLSNLDKVGIGA